MEKKKEKNMPPYNLNTFQNIPYPSIKNALKREQIQIGEYPFLLSPHNTPTSIRQ